MPFLDLFDKNACNIFGRNNGLESWTWDEYHAKKTELGDRLVLVDMIGHPVEGSVSISERMFEGAYPDGTVFALYCHSGGTSGYFQMRMAPEKPQYAFVNVK